MEGFFCGKYAGCSTVQRLLRVPHGSSESHPFYTGTQKSVDNMGGRVEKFRNRFGKTTSTSAAPAAADK